MQTIERKIIKNTIFNAVARIFAFIVAIMLLPYIVRHIGAVKYGVWAIVSVITGYFSLLDFGIGATFIKEVAAFDAEGNQHGINQIVNMGFVFYAILTVILTIIAFTLIDTVILFLKIPQEVRSEAKFVFILAIITFGVSNAIGTFSAVSNGLQRMEITSMVSIAGSIISALGVLFFIENGYGLRGLMINNTLVLLISGVVNIILAYKLFPSLKFDPWYFWEWKRFKNLLRFGYKVQIAKIEDLITFQTDKIILAYFLGIGVVTYYEVGSSIINTGRAIPLLLVTAIIPAASEISALGDKTRIVDLYSRGTKYLAVFGMPLMTLLFFTAPTLISLWVGEGYEKSVLIIQVLVPCYVINILTGVSSSASVGVGKPELPMHAALVQIILNLLLSVLLVKRLGFTGVAIATFISLSFSSIWFMISFHRRFNFPLLAFIKKILLIPALACVISSLMAGILKYDFLSLSIVGATGKLAVTVAVFIISYAAVIWKTGYVDQYDRDLLYRTLSHVWPR